MDGSQVTAAVKLLGKVLPDLSSTALTDTDGKSLSISVIRFSDKD